MANSGEGGSILDAVEKGVMVVESDPEGQSVGLGGLPDRDGNVTLDACIMDKYGNAGSVCFLQNILHPISVARKVMEETPHVMLAGDGAFKFAIEQGFKKEKERINMINASELNRLNREKERQKRSTARKMKKIAKKPRDSRKKVSDERINKILDRKPEHIKKTNRATWLQGQLALEGVNISTTQLRRRLNALAG